MSKSLECGLVDADGKQRIPASASPERQKLNRACWQRYETESYLLQPARLARYIDQHIAGRRDGRRPALFDAGIRRLFGNGIGAHIADSFVANPLQPSPMVEQIFGGDQSAYRH